MPRDRRRRRRAAARRSRSRIILLALLIAVTAGLAIGSLIEIPAQSGSYRTSIDTGYGAMASRVADASTLTGAELATLMDKAAQLPNKPIPLTARNEIQVGLDQAVSATSQQASEAAGLVPPYPTGSVSSRFTQVMSDRSKATSDLRTSIDRLLGMEPLPAAGAPTTSTQTGTAPLISIPRASAAMAAAGLLFEHADASYQTLIASIGRRHIPMHLPPSVWVTTPTADSPLGPVRLAASASALDNSPALVPFHQLVITSVGIVPPAVPPAPPGVAASGGPGIVGDSCSAPQSSVPGPTPVVLPPTRTISVAITVTNCGTVVESGVAVTQTVTPSIPVGSSAPPAGRRGGSTQTKVTLRSGSSIALSLPPLPVAGGHLYELAVSVAVPPQANPAGASQRFLIQISP